MRGDPAACFAVASSALFRSTAGSGDDGSAAVTAGQVEPVEADNATMGVAQASFEEPLVESLEYSEETMCDAGCDAGSPLVACDAPCPVPLIWGRADYLLWWTQAMDTPALATTSLAGTPQDQAGVLGDPNTSILFGTGGVNDQLRSGGRVTIGRWLDPEFCHGIDVTYVWLAEGSDGYRGSADDSSILARPFFNTQTSADDSRLIVFPDLVDGALAISTSTDFRSLEAVWRRSMVQRMNAQTDYFIGYRYADLEDLVRVDESTVSLAGPTIGSTFRLFDQFDTQNEFHGGELGIRILRYWNACWSVELTAQVALGGTSSKVSVAGQTEATAVDGQTAVTDSGLLVQSTNRGVFERDTFSTLSEAGVTLRRQFACGLAARFGYTFLYWSDVLRAGEQIDLAINPTQIPPGTLDGEARPALPLDTAGFWAQGLHFGLDYRY